MIEKIMKAVKRGNKKRSRNITIGAVIGFLLSCTVVMGATSDNYLWIREKDKTIQFNKEPTTDADGSGGTWNEKNPYENAGNIWDKDTETKTYINNITLLSSEKNGEYYDGYSNYDISYGLRLSGNLTDVNFVNNGSIIGIISGSSSYGYGIYNLAIMGNIVNTGVINGYGNSTGGKGIGYGIYNLAIMGNITNTGLISGDGSGSSSYGYGIYNDSSSEIKEITNTGIISGTGKSEGSGAGYGIYNRTAKMGNITNRGVISGTGKNEGSGASIGYGINNKSAKIGDIENVGLISGYATSTSSSYGSGIRINNESGTIENIKNTGIISGSGNSILGSASTSNGAGHGIYNGSSAKMGNIENIGVISGTGISTSGTGESYGIMNYNSEMKNIENTGEISGSGKSSGNNKTGTGAGIYNNSSIMGKITNTGIISGTGISSSGNGTGYGINNESGTMGAITNTGVIYGTNNAIKNDSGTIGTVNNYGILATKGSSVYTDTINNYGMYITEADGKITVASTKSDYSEEIAVEYDENGEVIKSRSMTIKNAVLIGNSGSATSSESIELGSNNYDNYILNGKDETLKVTDTNNQVTGSIINAYGTAVVFGEGNKQLTLSGTIVNGGIDEDDSNPGTKVAEKFKMLLTMIKE